MTPRIDNFSGFAQQSVVKLLTLLAIPVGVVAPFTQFLSGILIGLPLVGLVMLLGLSVVWMLILAPLVATGWAWEHLVLTRPIVLVIALPFVILGYLFNRLIAVGPEDKDSQAAQLVAIVLWPFTLPALRKTTPEWLNEALERGELRIPESFLAVQAGAASIGCLIFLVVLVAALAYLFYSLLF